jgi:hypothetical protein
VSYRLLGMSRGFGLKNVVCVGGVESVLLVVLVGGGGGSRYQSQAEKVKVGAVALSWQGLRVT